MSTEEKATNFWLEFQNLRKRFDVTGVWTTNMETCEARFADGTYVIIDDSEKRIVIGTNERS